MQRVFEIIFSNRKNLENFSILLFVNILTAGVGWLTQIKIANSVGKEVFGQIAFGVVLGTYGQVFIRFGLDHTLVRDLIHYPDRFADIIRASLFLRYTLAIISILGFIILNIINTSSKLEWGIILIFSALALLSLDLQPVYDALQRMQRHAIYFMIQKAFYLLIIWIMILFFPSHLSLFWVGMAMLFASLLYLLMQHRWAINHIASHALANNTLISDICWLINKNWLIWLAAICGLVAAMLNQPVLKYYAGDSELGGYAAAWQVMMIGHLFVDQLGRFGRPGMARYTRPEITNDSLIRFLLKYSVAMMGVALPLTIIMICIPDYIFQLLFKPEYAAASKTLPVFGSYLLLFALGVVASQYVLSVRLEVIYFFSVLIGGLTSVILCYLIIPEYKSIGAAWVLFLAHGSSLVVYAIAMVRHIQKKC